MKDFKVKKVNKESKYSLETAKSKTKLSASVLAAAGLLIVGCVTDNTDPEPDPPMAGVLAASSSSSEISSSSMPLDGVPTILLRKNTNDIEYQKIEKDNLKGDRSVDELIRFCEIYT